jgi:hypothetical protein
MPIMHWFENLWESRSAYVWTLCGCMKSCGAVALAAHMLVPPLRPTPSALDAPRAPAPPRPAGSGPPLVRPLISQGLCPLLSALAGRLAGSHAPRRGPEQLPFLMLPLPPPTHPP